MKGIRSRARSVQVVRNAAGGIDMVTEDGEKRPMRVAALEPKKMKVAELKTELTRCIEVTVHRRFFTLNLSCLPAHHSLLAAAPAARP